MPNVNFDIEVKDLTVFGSGKHTAVNVEFDADSGDVLSHIDIKDVIAYYGSEDLLENIGADSAKDYFGLVEAE